MVDHDGWVWCARIERTKRGRNHPPPLQVDNFKTRLSRKLPSLWNWRLQNLQVLGDFLQLCRFATSKNAFQARHLPVLQVENVKTRKYCETSSSFVGSQLQNTHFRRWERQNAQVLRNFLQLCKFTTSKLAFQARRLPVLQVENLKPMPSHETCSSFVTHNFKTVSFETFLLILRRLPTWMATWLATYFHQATCLNDYWLAIYFTGYLTCYLFWQILCPNLQICSPNFLWPSTRIKVLCKEPRHL